MTGEKPPVFQSARNAYADTSRAVAAMPSLTFVVFAISLVYGVLDYSVGHLVGTDIERGYGPLLASSAVGLVWNFFLTPFFIAVHRFIVLGEITPRYELRPGHPRFLKFFGWAVFLWALVTIPSLLIPLASRSSTGLSLVTTALTVGFVFVSVRSIILFPAIAVDAPGATWSGAFTDTKGCFWRIFAIIAFTMVPAIIVAFVLIFPTLPSVDDPGGDATLVLPSLPASMVASALSAVAAALAVAAASRLYRAIGDRVKRAD